VSHFIEQTTLLRMPDPPEPANLKFRRLTGVMTAVYKVVIGKYDIQTVPVLFMNSSAATRGNGNC